MAYATVLIDVETDGFEYTKMHCAAVKPFIPSAIPKAPLLFTDVLELEDWCDSHTDDQTIWVGHNICGFDYWALKDLTHIPIRRSRLWDTSVVSKLLDYRKYQTHSLAEIGKSLGVHKGDYTGGFEHYTKEMGEYCVQDVEVLYAIYKSQVKESIPQTAFHTEHEIALICAEMQRDGFKFNLDKADKLLAEVKHDMSVLEDELQKAYPPKLVEDRRIQWRTTKAGAPYATCLKAMADAPKWERQGDELVLYRWQEFSPGSPKQRIDVLWEAGWKPYDKTKGHMQWLRESR
jgi:hypothetical protein